MRENFARTPHPSRHRGFTLVELMIAMAVVAILAMLAYPSFMDQVRKGRRADAVESLSRLQQAQERWRSNNPNYTTTLTNLGIAATTPQGLYTLSVPAAASDSYTLRATAVSGRSQANDAVSGTSCTQMNIALAAGVITYTPARCWNR